MRDSGKEREVGLHLQLEKDVASFFLIHIRQSTRKLTRHAICIMEKMTWSITVNTSYGIVVGNYHYKEINATILNKPIYKIT